MTTTKKIVDDVTSRCAAGRTLITARRITRLYDDALRPADLTITQFTLLAVIQGFSPGSITALGEALSIDRTTLTRNLKPLEAAGLVERGDEGVRRQRAIKITERGRKKLKAAYPLWRAAQEGLEKDFEGDDFRAVMESLHSLAAAAKT